ASSESRPRSSTQTTQNEKKDRKGPPTQVSDDGDQRAGVCLMNSRFFCVLVFLSALFALSFSVWLRSTLPNRNATERHAHLDVAQHQKRERLAVPVQAQTEIDSAFQRIVNDEIHRWKVGQDVTLTGRRSFVRQRGQYAGFGQLLEQV